MYIYIYIYIHTHTNLRVWADVGPWETAECTWVFIEGGVQSEGGAVDGVSIV